MIRSTTGSGDDEVEKLLRHGEGWLDGHPSRDVIARAISVHQRGGWFVTRLPGLTAEEQPEEEAAAARKDEQEASIERDDQPERAAASTPCSTC